MTNQTLVIGDLLRSFTVQAQFVLRDGNRPALEVLYRIDTDLGTGVLIRYAGCGALRPRAVTLVVGWLWTAACYGTSISDLVKQRMLAAGYTESVEAYVVQTEDFVSG